MSKIGFLMQTNDTGSMRARPIDQDTLDTMLANGEIELCRGQPPTYHIKPKATSVTKEEDEDEDDLGLYQTKVMTPTRQPQRRRR